MSLIFYPLCANAAEPLTNLIRRAQVEEQEYQFKKKEKEVIQLIKNNCINRRNWVEMCFDKWGIEKFEYSLPADITQPQHKQ